ncbi:MAG: endo-1,4-beta-xylanase [Brevinematales bacterium]|nr:endo-1,4-beta-xylanase [Brevinematales bacterium]
MLKRLTLILVLIFLASYLNAQENLLGLRNLAKERNIYIGTAVMSQYLDDAEFVKVLTNNFSYLTPENEMKWELIHPANGRYDFTGADKIVNFAMKNGMSVRGHTLAWHFQNPAWLGSSLSKEKAIEILRDHIKTVVGRYKGKVRDWDVVNEPMDENGSLRKNIWYNAIGEEYIEMALKWANEADPQAKLFLNDYSVEGRGAKSDGFYNLVKKLKEKGAPIHGVGLQFHLDGLYFPDFMAYVENVKRFKELGLEVHITELDVRIQGKPTEKDINQHKRIYGELMKLALAYDCEAFITWGLSDKHSWIPTFFIGYGYGLMFDKDYKPKPAAFAVKDVLEGDRPTRAYFEKLTSSSERSLPTFRGVKATKIPVIDGKWSEEEWKGAYVYPFAFNQLDTQNFTPVDSQDDIYGNFRIMYNGSKIYGLVIRRDDKTITHHKNPWDNDNFELFYNIDGNWKQIRTIVGMGWQKDNNVNGNAIWSTDGSILEFVVDTGVDLTGKTIGFNAALSDNDTPESELRKCQLYPIVGNNTGWQGKGFGEMTFQNEKGAFVDGKLIGDIMPFVAVATKTQIKLDGKADEWKEAVKYPLMYNILGKNQAISYYGKNVANFKLFTVKDSIYGLVEFVDNTNVNIEFFEFAFYVDGKTTIGKFVKGKGVEGNVNAKVSWSKDNKLCEFVIKVSDKSIEGKRAKFSLTVSGNDKDGKFILSPFCSYNAIGEENVKDLGAIMSKKGIEFADIVCQ